MTTESNKQKIAKIHDIFPTATKDQIAKILQYYEDDENKALDALTRDGGCEALSNLAESGSIKSKNNKNKKKKKKGRKETDLAGSSTASFDADDSSSLHSTGNADAEVEKECSVTESRNGILPDSVEEQKSSHERLNTPETDASSSGSKDCVTSSKGGLASEQEANRSTPELPKCSNTEMENPTCASPVSDCSDKQEDPNLKKERYRSTKEESHGKYSSRQRTNSFRRSKTASFCEDAINTHSSQNTAVPTKRGYEKCKKDLNRQTISLQRIHSQVEKGLDESSKKLKNSFNELRKSLDKRQEQLEQELAKSKEEALNILKSRQELAVELKRRVDRTPSLSETEWTELRSDVKQFVTERKYDDDLGKTIWFQWSVETITEAIDGFGEVHPVKNVYSQRSHSALGNAVVAQNNPEPSPSSSLANEEIGSTADKNDVAIISDAVDDEAPVVKKDVPAPIPRTQPCENRSRIFSNTKFQNNRGNKGGYRGNRGFGYPRPNNRNMSFRTYYDYEYRNHSHQDRDNRIHDNSMYSNDNRNMNNHRNNRRGHNNHYRVARFRGNGGQQRHNEAVAKTEPNESSAVPSEKSNIVNGFHN